MYWYWFIKQFSSSPTIPHSKSAIFQSCNCFSLLKNLNQLPSTLIISKSKGLSEIIWDIRTLTYQICRIKGKLNQTATFSKWICNVTPEVVDILKILWKRGEIAPEEQSLLFLFSTTFCYLSLDFHVKTGPRFSLRDKRLFEISEVKIVRVDY